MLQTCTLPGRLWKNFLQDCWFRSRLVPIKPTLKEKENLDVFTLHWLDCVTEPQQAAAWLRIAMVLHCGAGGARKVGGGGVFPAPVVGPEAHLLLAWLGRLLEWSCARYALSQTPPSETPLTPTPFMACSYGCVLARLGVRVVCVQARMKEGSPSMMQGSCMPFPRLVWPKWSPA